MYAMGGDMKVESRIGQGTTFTFDIQTAIVDEQTIAQASKIRRAIALEPGQHALRSERAPH